MVTFAGISPSVVVGLTPGAAVTYPTSKKLAILRALCTHLEGITRANGYEFNMQPQISDNGKMVPRVVRGRTVFGDSDPVPLISVLEGPVPDKDPVPVGVNEVQRTDDWIQFVQGWTHTPEDYPTDPAYQLMAAVEKRLSEIISVRKSGLPVNPAVYLLGNSIAGFAIGPGVVRPPQDGVSSKAFFYLPVIIRLPVDVTRPFVAA